MNMGIYEEAIGYFEQQLATLEQLSSHTSVTDKVNNFNYNFFSYLFSIKFFFLLNRVERLAILVIVMMH